MNNSVISNLKSNKFRQLKENKYYVFVQKIKQKSYDIKQNKKQ